MRCFAFLIVLLVSLAFCDVASAQCGTTARTGPFARIHTRRTVTTVFVPMTTPSCSGRLGDPTNPCAGNTGLALLGCNGTTQFQIPQPSPPGSTSSFLIFDPTTDPPSIYFSNLATMIAKHPELLRQLRKDLEKDAAAEKAGK